MDGCEVKFNVGIEEKDLEDFVLEDANCVRVKIHIYGKPCIHQWRKSYAGPLLGKARDHQVQAIADGEDKFVRPARRGQNNLDKIDSAKLAVGNHEGLATKRELQYDLGREAKNIERDKLNLTG